MRVTLPDQLCERIQRAHPKMKLDLACTAVLGQYGHIPNTDRTLLIRAQDLDRIEKTVGRSMKDGTDLADLVYELSVVTVGGAELILSPRTMESLKRRATFESKDPAEVLQEFITEIEDQVMAMAIF